MGLVFFSETHKHCTLHCIYELL
uniref:Uncharacterized protein n=1 Tax=Anguilla anguilla TaxID=7936 RepID=A0A0E9T0H6_ANGAN